MKGARNQQRLKDFADFIGPQNLFDRVQVPGSFQRECTPDAGLVLVCDCVLVDLANSEDERCHLHPDAQRIGGHLGKSPEPNDRVS
jgi:hypothetical protein